MVSGWSSTVFIERFSVLPRRPLSNRYAEENGLPLWLFVIAVAGTVVVGVLAFSAWILRHVPVASFFSSKSGMYDTERKPREPTTVSFPWFRDPQLFCLLLTTFQSLLFS